ncbi:MAG: oligosaccharide flippase family protein [Thermoplasmatales archaeon]|nr:oligosaccharide flippase family protein [Thermoplasmatales archaeon]
MQTDKDASKNNSLNDPLQKIVKGTGLVITGSLLVYLFALIGGVLIARYWTENEVGIHSIASSLFVICITICAVGISQGSVRSIAHAKGKKEFKNIPEYIVTTFVWGGLTSIILGSMLFIFSGTIAENIFHESSLIQPIRIYALTLPFFVFNYITVQIFRGFENIKPLVYFKYILESSLFPVFVVAIIFLNLPFVYIFYSSFLSGIIISIILIIYTLRPTSIKRYSIKSIFSPAAKELLVFSIPLTITHLLFLLISWSSIILLGVFKSTGDAGFYQVASPFAKFIVFPLGALLVTFTPVFSRIYAKNQLKDIRSNYKILTKWICLITFPIFLIFFLFPELVLSVIVGPNYLPSANVLRILSLAHIISNLVGPCGSTLVAMGKSQFIMFSTLATAMLAVTLSILLIPTYNYIGAAIAFVISILFISIISTLKIYSLGKITPFGRNLIKPTLLLTAIIVPFYFIFNQYIPVQWWSLISLFILVYGIYIICVLVTKSLEDEDLKMLIALEQKTGIKITIISKIIKKFM